MVLFLHWGSSSVDEWSHIPLPCGAALLPLPLGTGHETYISTTMILFYLSKKKIALYIFQYKNTSYTYNSSIDFYIAQIVGCPIFFIFHHISCENNFEVGRSKTSGIY